MVIQQVAQKFVDGEYEDLAGLGLHDVVHVLATRYGLDKAYLRAEIQRLYIELIPEDPQPVELDEEYVEFEPEEYSNELPDF